MADDGVKISELPEILTAPTSGEMVPEVKGGVTYKRDIGALLPTSTQKSALAGYGGTPSASNPYATQAAVKPLSDLSRVMRINGDGVPIFPDNAAGVLYTRDKNWTVTTGWTGGTGVTLSIENSLLKVVSSTPGIANINITNPAHQNKLIRIVIKSNDPIADITTLTGSSVYTRMRMSYIGGGRYVADVYWSRTGSDVFNIWPNQTTSAMTTWYLETIQIGSGLYDTPVYGKDGQAVAVNHGVVPVNGKRGKALLFQGAQYLQFDNPVIGTSGTIAMKVNNFSAGIILSNESYGTSGFTLEVTSATSLVLRMSHSGTNTTFPINCTNNSDIVIALYNGNIQIYVDGTLYTTLTFSNIIQGTENLNIGARAGEYCFVGTINDLRYDTATWTQDDVTRYHNGDDPIDCQQKSVTNTPNALKICDSKGNIRQPGLPVYADNAAALAGGLVAGEPYRTSTGVMMVTY